MMRHYTFIGGQKQKYCSNRIKMVPNPSFILFLQSKMEDEGRKSGGRDANPGPPSLSDGRTRPGGRGLHQPQLWRGQ